MRKYYVPLLALVLSACVSLDPTYKRPEAPIPTEWPSASGYAAAQMADRTAADIPWRQFVKEEKLRTVVAQALSNSRDLRNMFDNAIKVLALHNIAVPAIFQHL